MLAHDRFFCGEKLTAFYTRLALKWPFYWSKWWVTPAILSKYTVDQQLTYLLKVKCTPEVIFHLSKEAKAKLVRAYPLKLKELLGKIRITDDLFEEILNQDGASMLEGYLKKGTISGPQQLLLARCAAQESRTYLSSPAILLLYEYTERCGLRKDVLEEIKSSKASVGFKVKINAVRHFAGAYNYQWVGFLCRNSLSAVAEQEMSVHQYLVFSKNGYKLHEETILYWLQQSDKAFHKAIFRNEPEHGLITEKIKKLVEDTPHLKALYNEIVEDED